MIDVRLKFGMRDGPRAEPEGGGLPPTRLQ
jgi:hypothetical protein